MLKYLINSFENTSLRLKIELYILPLLLIFLLYLLVFEEKQNENLEDENKIFLEFENKKYEKSSLELLKDIEVLASKDFIVIQKIQNIKEQIFIQAKAGKEALNIFLFNLENLNAFTKIETLNLKEFDKENYFFDLKLDISRFYIKEKKQKKEITYKKEEKLEQLQEEVKTMQNPQMKLFAIVGEFAFINDTWLKAKDEYEGYKLILIAKDFVILENEFSSIKLEVNNFESIKNSN